MPRSHRAVANGVFERHGPGFEFGSATLSVPIDALQILLDRGRELDWLGSREIRSKRSYRERPFGCSRCRPSRRGDRWSIRIVLRPQLCRQHALCVIIRASVFASAGAACALSAKPDGFSDPNRWLGHSPARLVPLSAMMVVGQPIGRLDTRLLLGVGLAPTAGAMWDMTGWTPDVLTWTVAVNSVIQGAGMGFLFVPLSTTTLATLAMGQRAQGAGLFQPLPQSRFERRRLDALGPAGQQYSGPTRGHRGLYHRVNRSSSCSAARRWGRAERPARTHGAV